MDTTPTLPAESTRSDEHPTATRETRIARVTIGVVVSVLGIGAFVGLRNEWTPILDIAALELRVQAMGEFIPQVGVFSRMGWFHPGPSIFFQSWLPYRVLGPVGLNIAMVLVHLSALVLAWWLARRQDRLAGGIVLVTMLAVLLVEPAVVALEPWNPYAGTIASFTFLMAAWGVSERRWVATALMFPVGSYLVHNHVGYVPFVALVAFTAILLAWKLSLRGVPAPWGAWIVGACITVAMWLPVLWQQVTGDPGNLTALLTTPAEGARAGVVTGMKTLFDSFALVPYWASGETLAFRSTWQFPWLLLVPIIGAVVAYRHRDAQAGRMLALSAAACIAGVVAITVTTGPLVGYLVIWLPVTAATSVAMGLWAALRGFATPMWTVVAYATAVVVSVLVAVSWARAEQEYPEYGRASLTLGSALHEQSAGDPVYLSNLPGQGLAQLLDIRQVYYGVLATAVREGTDVIVPEPISWEVGGVLPANAMPSAVPGLPNYAVTILRSDLTEAVAVYNPLTPAETEEFLRLEDQITQAAADSPEQIELIRARDRLAEGRFPFALVRVNP